MKRVQLDLQDRPVILVLLAAVPQVKLVYPVQRVPPAHLELARPGPQVPPVQREGLAILVLPERAQRAKPDQLVTLVLRGILDQLDQQVIRELQD